MRLRTLIITAILSVSMIIPCYGMTAHELAMSYILADQDKPIKAGDKFYTEENEPNPMLCETTAYFEGTHGSHGDRMRIGYVAYTPETYGYAMEVYQAIPTNAGYEIGKFIGLYEVRDTGYGRTTYQGESVVRSDKKHAGTIETGLTVDRYCPTLAECQAWMKQTNGMIFIRLIPAKG